MDVKVPTNIVELLTLEQRWMDAQIFVNQSDHQEEIEKAYKFIEACEKAFTECKVKFSYD